MSLSLYQSLMLYLWFPLAVVLVLLLLIARFYERFSGTRTYFRWFLIPLILFGVGAVRYASLEAITGDVWADLALGVGGMVLSVLCVRLYWLMMIRQRPATKPLSDPD